MIMQKRFVLFALVAIFTISCNSQTSDTNKLNSCEYASYFNIKHSGDTSIIEVTESWSEENKKTTEYSFNQPLKRVVCMSTSHLAYIIALGERESVVGISGGEYISDSLIRNRVASGEISDIGYEGSLNYEKLISLKPDIVFTYGINGENNLYIDRLRQYGIKVMVLGDYLEEHPLGKLEYLKLFGELFRCRQKADSLYEARRDKYEKIKAKAAEFKVKPLVLLNAPWKEVWYVPGEENYISVLINDAGGVVAGARPNESRSYPSNTEQVFKIAMEADFWLNPNSFSTLKELEDSNPLFKSIPSLKQNRVFNNNKRKTPGGGSDFWETGVVEPDEILEDLINILHGDAKPDSLKYYVKL